MLSRGNFVLCIALAEPRYARNNVSVELRGMSVFNNDIPRGSVIFVVDSKLETYEVRTKRIVTYARFGTMIQRNIILHTSVATWWCGISIPHICTYILLMHHQLSQVCHLRSSRRSLPPIGASAIIVVR